MVEVSETAGDVGKAARGKTKKGAKPPKKKTTDKPMDQDEEPIKARLNSVLVHYFFYRKSSLFSKS